MRASHIKTFPGHGSFTSSNLVGETHVPRNAPGTPQANACFRPPGTHARSADEADGSEERRGACARRAVRQKQAGSGSSRRARAAAGGLGAEAWRARGEREVPGQANAPLAPGRSGRLSGTPPAPGRRDPALREPTMRSGRPRRRRRNAGADPLGHRSFMESA
jgi:hypothetical protein